MEILVLLLALVSLLTVTESFTLRSRVFVPRKVHLEVKSSTSPMRTAISPLFSSAVPPVLTPNKMLFQELESQIKKDQDSDTSIKKSSKFAFESNWVLALHNDMQHTVEEVAELLHKVVNCPYEHALKVTREVHFTGHGVVAVEAKPLIEMYADALVEYGLTVSTYPDEPLGEDGSSSGGGGNGGRSLP